MTELRGSCLCGGVRFEIDGPLMRSSHCHAGSARRRMARRSAHGRAPPPPISAFSPARSLSPSMSRRLARIAASAKCVAHRWWSNSTNTRAARRPTPAPWHSMVSRWRRSTTTPASAPTHTRLSSTKHRGSRSPTTCPNTQRVSPARMHRTNPDRPIAGLPDSSRRRRGSRSQTSMKTCSRRAG